MTVLRCSECRGTFPWEGSWPDYCPLCGYNMALPDGDNVAAPAIGHPQTRATDRVHRDIERGSEIRAELAAQLLGVSPSEMAALKITDVPGPVSNEVTRFMNAHGVGGMRSDGAQYSPAVQSGPFPNAGLRTLEAVRAVHGGPKTDAPANETTHPGYVRR
jgi:hypothetical protein